jgi:DNA-binding cell septation regulator SpoVG
VEITEVRIKLVEHATERLLAFCSITIDAGFVVREAPIHFIDRQVGNSKMSGKVAREALMLVPKLRFRVKRSKAKR